MITTGLDLSHTPLLNNKMSLDQAEVVLDRMVALDLTFFQLPKFRIQGERVQLQEEFLKAFVERTPQQAIEAMLYGAMLPQNVFEAIRSPLVNSCAIRGILHMMGSGGTVYNLILKYFGRVKNINNLPRKMYKSKEMELQVLSYFQQQNPHFDVVIGEHFINPKLPYLACSPDGFAFNRHGQLEMGLEVKTFRKGSLKTHANEQFGIFDHIRDQDDHLLLHKESEAWYQVQFSMFILNLQKYVVLLYFPETGELGRCNVDRDDYFLKGPLNQIQYYYASMILPTLADVVHDIEAI